MKACLSYLLIIIPITMYLLSFKIRYRFSEYSSQLRSSIKSFISLKLSANVLADFVQRLKKKQNVSLRKTCQNTSFVYNPFAPNAPFFYSFKASFFCGREKGCIGNKCVKQENRGQRKPVSGRFCVVCRSKIDLLVPRQPYRVSCFKKN